MQTHTQAATKTLTLKQRKKEEEEVVVVVVDEEDDDDVNDLCEDLSKLTVAELKKELAGCSLSTTGVKATLVARLEESRRGGNNNNNNNRKRPSSSSSRKSEEERETEAVRRDVPPLAPTTGKSESLDAVFASRSSSVTSSASSSGRSSGSGMSGAGAEEEEDEAFPRRHPVLLVLDETLQRLPWETMPLLKGHPVSRCPSLEYIDAALRRRLGREESDGGATTTTTSKSKAKKASKAKQQERSDIVAAAPPPSLLPVPSSPGFYVLDPEANLATTRATLQPALEALGRSSSRHTHTHTQNDQAVVPKWEGLTGQAPTEEWLKEKLSSTSVFVYCGHGSGELFLPREDVAALPQAPLAVLMGCSSGKLRAPTPIFEPTGMALSYLMGGSPAVVGNLWDVTDRDIDRFSLVLLGEIFSSSSSSSSSTVDVDGVVLLEEEEEEQEGEEKTRKRLLLSAVAKARRACKLSYLVGAAPCVYGLPVKLV